VCHYNSSQNFAIRRVCLPGVFAVEGPKFQPGANRADSSCHRFCGHFPDQSPIKKFPLIVIVDDSEFTARQLKNFLWVVFTRSNPASDIRGIGSFTEQKHWGCRGSLVIDARIKPHHAPPLVEDPEVTRRVDQLAAPNGPLHGIL
jgi:4-hydroxy-3-polyprenylbenzoate decarboxylase